MKVFRRDLQGIFLGMKDIPTRDVSAFTMVRNLIIGSLPRATSRKRNLRKDKNKVTPLPRKTQCSERDISRASKNSIHEILRQTARKNSKNEETEVNKRSVKITRPGPKNSIKYQQFSVKGVSKEKKYVQTDINTLDSGSLAKNKRSSPIPSNASLGALKTEE